MYAYVTWWFPGVPLKKPSSYWAITMNGNPHMNVYGGFLKKGYPKMNDSFIMENASKKADDLGVPLFQETLTYIQVS